jgi:hypothetical protein
MRRGTGRGRAAHGVRRAARHRNNGENSSTIENVTTTRQHLQYKEIITGMGYEINKKHEEAGIREHGGVAQIRETPEWKTRT